MIVNMLSTFDDHPDARIEAFRAMLSDLTRRRIQITYFEERPREFAYMGIIGEPYERRQPRPRPICPPTPVVDENGYSPGTGTIPNGVPRG